MSLPPPGGGGDLLLRIPPFPFLCLSFHFCVPFCPMFRFAGLVRNIWLTVGCCLVCWRPSCLLRFVWFIRDLLADRSCAVRGTRYHTLIRVRTRQVPPSLRTRGPKMEIRFAWFGWLAILVSPSCWRPCIHFPRSITCLICSGAPHQEGPPCSALRAGFHLITNQRLDFRSVKTQQMRLLCLSVAY